MDHQDHVFLLEKGIPKPGGVWADFGSGRGAFTLALADLIGPGGRIFSVDKNRSALTQQEKALQARFPAVAVQYRKADFTKPLELPLLDGLIVANALHFLRRKDEAIRRLAGYLKPGGRFLVVEYDADRGNPWVPYPFSYDSWTTLASRNGLSGTEFLATVPSSFLRRFYSAISYKAAAVE